jgi:fanconi anemia group M protein
MKKSNSKTSKLSKQHQQQQPITTDQKTLFQCWKENKPTTSNQPSISNLNSNLSSNSNEYSSTYLNPNYKNEEEKEEEDEGDLELITTTDAFLLEKSINNETNMDTTDNNESIGFDKHSGSVWIYPINMPIRDYQFNIVQQVLNRNTMVVLPTGLGKTFIAAVAMFNYYRWFPLGKVIFMAPTKPLVNQQCDACGSIVGLPKEDMIQMTGNMQPEKRKLLWETKRVFFLTPQCISNDIVRGIIDVNSIKMVVIDEAFDSFF